MVRRVVNLPDDRVRLEVVDKDGFAMASCGPRKTWETAAPCVQELAWMSLEFELGIYKRDRANYG